ncbi:MAG TPA: Rieske (2Fe-2S) protein, partial [Steroidobacteraceae bacterium]|nr:Rieske (2Fe-2S) protein [Steroidobacteraceae bacterium]
MFIPLASGRPTTFRPHTSQISQNDWDVLADFWHPVALASDVKDRPLAAKLLDVGLVLFRGVDGTVAVAIDVCPHRHIRLSTGKVIDGEIVCPFHGMRFDVSGRCQLIPAMGGKVNLPASYRVATFASCERYGLIWVCLGQSGKHSVPDFPALDGVPVSELEFLGPQSWP